jgi:hypothetical protein
MADEDTTTPEIKEIEFRDRKLQCRFPDWQQWVALTEMEEIARVSYAQFTHHRDQALAAREAGTDSADSEQKALAAAMLTIDQSRSLIRIFKGLLVEPMDYSWLVGSFGSGDLTKEDLGLLLRTILEAFGDEQPEPANRQQKRRAKRAT